MVVNKDVTQEVTHILTPYPAPSRPSHTMCEQILQISNYEKEEKLVLCAVIVMLF